MKTETKIETPITNGSTPQLPATVEPAALPAQQTQATGNRGRLALALSKAQARCRSVAPDKRNAFHKYDYASAEAVLGEAKDALADSGLALVPIEQNITGSSKEGEDRYELERKFLLLHESGEILPISLHWPVVVDKGKPLDKAAAAAATSSLAYLLRDLLMMPRVKDADDISGREDKGPAKQQPEDRQKKAPPANGMELYKRLEAKGIEVLKAVIAAGAKAGFPKSMHDWNTAQISYGTGVAKDFLAQPKTAPAEAKGEPSQASATGTTPAEPTSDREAGEPDPAEVIGPVEVKELEAVRNKAGVSWGDCVAKLNRECNADLPDDATPDVLTWGQFTALMNALKARASKKAG